MNVSRAKALALLLGVSLPVLAAHAALAQPVAAPGQPLILNSPNLESTVDPALAPKADPAQPPRTKTGGRFEVEELKAPDQEAVGVLDQSQGGLGDGLWRGSQAAVVRQLLPRLPVLPSSRAMRLLERRLLLSAAPAPEGNQGQSPSLLEIRAERLYALGDVDGLSGLLKAAPANLSSPALSRLKIDTYLLAGDTKAACSEAALAAQAAPLDPRLTIFCQIAGGKALEANMALDLMRERKDADHAFIAAAEAMAGTPPAAEERHAFAATARLYAPLVAEIRPAPELAAFAPILARGLYAAGRPETALAWTSLAKADPASAKAAAALWPLARLARPGSDHSPPEFLASWLAAAEGSERRAVMGLEVLQAVGESVPAADWLPLAMGTAGTPGPRPALKAMLRNAAEGVRLGEAVLLSLLALAEVGLDSADPDTVNRVMVALRMVGLDREARDLGTEAALANGL
ncbi:MAG: antifreeze protein [Magnetospirillum sp.]|nr:antifreeze protein [Magnetospirillum sp.]